MTTDPVGTALAAILFTLAAVVGLGVVFYGPVKRMIAERRGYPRIRWYNRLAAWVYPRITEPLVTLAVPVWDAEAQEDYRQWREDEEARSTWDKPADVDLPY